MARLPFVRDAVPKIPMAPGVYLFLDASGKAIYVGKAMNLRSRVRSYFGSSGDQRMVTRYLGGVAETMDFVVCGSEKEALILENSLIKKHAPRFNIRLRDDKTYFSLRLDLAHEWPRLTIVRRRKKDEALYFGPYTSAQACRKTIQYLNGIFPLRTCRDSVLYNRTRPCISHEIGRCVAPCVGLTTQEHYRQLLDRVIRFLRGQDREILAELESEMREAARLLQFERAAEIRDRLRHIRTTLEHPQVARRGGIDRDVVGIYDQGEELMCAVLQVRDGSLAQTASFTFRKYAELDGILASFLGQFYAPPRTPPPEIILPAVCEDLELYQELLEERRGAAVAIRVPQRGEALRLLRLAERNAELSAQRKKAGDAEVQATLEELQEKLDLVHYPARIECYDVSHLGGEQVVASGVSFLHGMPDKSRYKRYRLREVRRNDDFAAMEEVLGRRLRRGLRDEDLPELIVLDGGPPQLERVLRVLRELGIDRLDVIGLAKARAAARGTSLARASERVWLPGRAAPVLLRDEDGWSLLLQRLRNEAHRFAIGYSRKLRGKEKITTVLEMIPGIGARRARSLLTHLGSVKEVKAASLEDLAAAPGMTRPAAEEILRFFAERGDPKHGDTEARSSEEQKPD
jgi:excinuclease ABC subunit C